MLPVLIALSAGAASATPVLLLFSDEPQPVFLGCLSCDSLSPDSVWNETGKYGNRFAAQSIWNSYGKYGSPYRKESVCNPYSSAPPKVVDVAGKYYGRLTKNTLAKDALVGSFQTVVTTVCGG